MSTRRAWREVIAAARARGGIIAAREAVELGVSRSSLDARVRDEAWQRPFRGVLVLSGTRVTSEVLALAALASLGRPSAMTGLTALAFDGVADRWPVVPHVLFPASRNATTQAGIHVTRSRTIEAADVITRSGIRVAFVPRAFPDAAASATSPLVRGLLIDGRQRRIADVEQIADRAARTVRAHGRGRLLRACSDVGGSGADSVLVAKVESWLRREGITFDVPPRSAPTHGRVLHPDLTVANVPIAIEVDGFGAHGSRRGLDLDQRKHNDYLLAR
jgi:hypothetical protein